MTYDLTDQNHLVRDQYRNAGNLEARIQIYSFGANRHSWHRWLFDHLELPDDARILEVGCGPATMWVENRDAIPSDWHITLTDLSPGMLADARANFGDTSHHVTFRVMDAQDIPYPDGSFDAVMANHMLYHMPDRAKAISELRRVLRPGGRLYASTLGKNHMRELNEIIQMLAPDLPYRRELGFLLENGADDLDVRFERVTMDRYPDTLMVTEIEPLLLYIGSERARAILQDERRDLLIAWAEAQIAEQGAVRITTDSGLFQAW